ncbi:hypothetical protein KP509_07G022600 [Ceratopteris richardii]|uniref:Uncharacterized protein n=1 Tax=Ceratopteris richardii TaxID=49495 RepID=A0A8T2U9A3_CERRI|nr:hypothetical protein KP509_07G022600 [Ceratopteris richardii]
MNVVPMLRLMFAKELLQLRLLRFRGRWRG